MKWLSNTHDPNDPNCEMYVVRLFDETQEEAVAHWREWLKGKTIGDPQPSEAYTVAQMKEMGLVGVYA